MRVHWGRIVGILALSALAIAFVMPYLSAWLD